MRAAPGDGGGYSTEGLAREAIVLVVGEDPAAVLDLEHLGVEVVRVLLGAPACWLALKDHSSGRRSRGS